MLGGRRAYRRWLPLAGEQAATQAARALVWQRGGLIAALAPAIVAALVLPSANSQSPDSPEGPIAWAFIYAIVASAFTQTVAFVRTLRVRGAALAHWGVTPEEKPTFPWRHPDRLERWLAEYRPNPSAQS